MADITSNTFRFPSSLKTLRLATKRSSSDWDWKHSPGLQDKDSVGSMSRGKHSSASNSPGLHSDAYAYQQWEFYPDYHEANIQRLHQKYPDVPLSEIAAVY